jgi:YesN/AraC family two-component response regulator
MTVRVLITDDHKVVRQGIKMVLDLDPDLDVVGEAENGEEALRLARQLKPDVVLMDLVMPVMNGIEATRGIRRELPDSQLVERSRRALSGTCSRTPALRNCAGR